MSEPDKGSLSWQGKDPLEGTSLAGIFALAMVALLLGTLWAFWDEVRGRRPWKGYQERFRVEAQDLLESQLAEARRALEGSEEYRDLASRLQEAARQLSGSSERQALGSQLAAIESRIASLRKQFMIARGKYQATAYRMEKSKDAEMRKRLLARVKRLEREADAVKREMDSLVGKKTELRRRLRNMDSEQETVRKRLSELEEPVRLIERRLAGVHSMPVQIRQYVNRELGVIDRCPSCHPAVEMQGFSELPSPFRNHPAVISTGSPHANGRGGILTAHQVERFGCTPCHRGQGYATTTVDKAHGRVEYWPTPMLEGDTVQGACLKCHSREPYLQGAVVLSKGRRLVSELGCFGCHNFGDYLTLEERSQQVGPDLRRLTSKVFPAWLVGWIGNPRAFRPDTAMPDFRFSRQEAEAIASYLWQNAGSAALPEVEPFTEDNVGPGRVLFETKGCLGCHRIGQKGRRAAPDLSRIGDKARYEFLANWVLAPHELDPRTEMPLLNLKPDEAVKIAAYLSTLRTEGNGGDSSVDLGSPELTDWGRSLITMYNCYGCHQVPGFENTEPLVPDIYNIGSKPVERLDFGLLEEEILSSGGLETLRENVGKARELWIRAKLKDPRGFDKRRYKKDSERLRMPDFSLSDDEVDALTTFLLGLTDESVPEAYRRVPTDTEQAVARGRFLFRAYRCYACHGEKGTGGVVNPNYVKGTVPALNAIAKTLMLWRQRDVEALTREIVRGVPLESLSEHPPVRRFSVVLAKYQILRDTIHNGSTAGRADPAGPQPPYSMPSWKEMLDSRDVDNLMLYFLSTRARPDR